MTKKLRSRQRARVNHQLEVLERRLLLANNIFLDFTPDTITNEYTVGKFADVFAQANVNSTNKFLDYNGDSQINLADAQLAAKNISSRLTRLLKPFMDDPSIELVVYNTTDLTSNADPGVGEVRLANGLSSATDTNYIIYVGNLRPSNNVPRFGVAQQQTAGSTLNITHMCLQAKSRNYMRDGNFEWKQFDSLTPMDFTNKWPLGSPMSWDICWVWGTCEPSTRPLELLRARHNIIM